MTTPSNNRKRKRQTISLAEKHNILDASTTRTAAQLVTHFNGKYKEDTIRKIINDKDKILKAIDDGASGMKAFSRAVKFPKLEEALLIWLKDVRSENVAVDGPMLKVSLHSLFTLFYAEQKAEDPKIIQACHLFEDFLHQEQMKNIVQAPITQFMPAKESNQPSIMQFFS